MTAHIPDRRQSVRKPTTGGIEISFANPVETTVQAELTEMSDSGFRITHESNELIPGLEIEVRLRLGSVARRARVIWTHVLNGRSVSGCLLL